MIWPTYDDDEVAVFHPAFENLAADALGRLGINGTYLWEHHPKSAGVGVVPDYVLVEKATKRWILVVEIKRTEASVRSERNQIQAKGYAEANASLFRAGCQHFFAITNLELFQLYASRGGMPPRDCLVEDQTHDWGRLTDGDRAAHRERMIKGLADVVRFSINERHPMFAVVWPAIVDTMFQHSRSLPFRPGMVTTTTIPSVVQDYFAISREDAARDEMLLRCLISEYARGILARHSHPRAHTLRATGTTLAAAANALRTLRSVDFAGVIEDAAAEIYLSFEGQSEIRKPIQDYLSMLLSQRVSDLASTRTDAPILADLIVRKSRPALVRDVRGKAGTDPELAQLLASLCIGAIDGRILDPGCGEGNLLSAAYDRLRTLGASHQDALNRLEGFDADGIAVRIAGLRLALKEPHALMPDDPIVTYLGDMFSLRSRVSVADIILMNPPFKRYEAQDEAPISPELRSHMVEALTGLEGAAETTEGQWNTLAAYAEYVLKAAKENAVLGLVLDNKWYHNNGSMALRRLFRERCRILAVVTYPHGRFFDGVMIATSMIVMEKAVPDESHEVLFMRVEDPGSTPANEAYSAIRGNALPSGWSVNRIRQSELGDDSWKANLSVPLTNEYRNAPLVQLVDLFRTSRRGSLAKEAGPVALLEFPTNRSTYGSSVSKLVGGAPFQTRRGTPLTSAQNAELRMRASRIPRSCLGFALNKADRVTGYRLTESDVSVDPTIELPLQRSPAYAARYDSNRRVPWTPDMDRLVADVPNHPELDDYVSSLGTKVGLNTTVLPTDQMWNVLREPHAGALVIPRKLRTTHHVHINGFAFKQGRQVRLSSNFISYGHCIATAPSAGLDEQTATVLVAAWLVSSFGHLQFELKANNREGMRAIEKNQTDGILCPDPRTISDTARTGIVAAFDALPFSIRTDLHPALQSELLVLDELFAAELQRIIPGLNGKATLAEVQNLLHDLHEARR